MPSLREWQHDFAHDLLSASSRTARFIRAESKARLQIYRNNVFGNYSSALQAVYPVVQKLVGENFFRRTAHQYVCEYPSSSGDIHAFGNHLPEFLAEFPGAAELHYLPDVARLEWLMHEAFHSADCEALPIERLLSVPPESYGELKFHLHPACRLFASPYPVLSIWQTNQADYMGDQRVDLAEGGVLLLLHRPRFTVEAAPLSPGAFALMSAFAAGSHFSDAVMAAIAAEPEFDPGLFLPEQVAHKVIVDFILESS